jgi:hypothetical protein
MTLTARLKDTALRILTRTRYESGPLPTECLIWQGGVNSAGYGVVYLTLEHRDGTRQHRGIRITVHRLMYCFATGQPIPKGMVIGHKCDRKLCCRHEHLEAIPQSQNVRDAWARGRRSRPKFLSLELPL